MRSSWLLGFMTLAMISSCVADITVKLSCSQLVIDRIDPLIDPGILGTSHVHQIVGGNAFNVTMDPDTPPSSLSTCTSCTFLNDFSNYWTASLYFRARNGSFKRVPQLGALFHEEANGGITIYYFGAPAGYNTTAFKKGFRMRNGDPSVRDADAASRFKGIGYDCLDREDTRFGRAPTFPTRFCKFGILTTIFFPPCWDGVNLDSPNHYSHVSFPTKGTYQDRVPCPASHPVSIPQLVLEIRWDTSPFNSVDLWPEDGSQPFLWSFGDRTGYGHHGDYIFGWKDNSLQQMFDVNCEPDMNCNRAPDQAISVANTCTKVQMVKEDVDGWLDELPGGVMVQG